MCSCAIFLHAFVVVAEIGLICFIFWAATYAAILLLELLLKFLVSRGD